MKAIQTDVYALKRLHPLKLAHLGIRHQRYKKLDMWTITNKRYVILKKYVGMWKFVTSRTIRHLHMSRGTT